jgi:hypothetical protein
VLPLPMPGLRAVSFSDLGLGYLVTVRFFGDFLVTGFFAVRFFSVTDLFGVGSTVTVIALALSTTSTVVVVVVGASVITGSLSATGSLSVTASAVSDTGAVVVVGAIVVVVVVVVGARVVVVVVGATPSIVPSHEMAQSPLVVTGLLLAPTN